MRYFLFSAGQYVFLSSLLLLLITGVAFAQDTPATQSSERPRVGLVLGGGGARGAAHIGVLEVLEELRVPVDCVAGTSMGALVAGVYAAGLTPTEMRSELGKADWISMFQDNPEYWELNPRNKAISRRFLPGSETGVTEDGVQYQSGMVSGQKIKLFFNYLVHDNLGARQIERLPLPLSIIATDVGNGERVVIREGSLTKAMRASMSVPGLMAPEERLGRLLVDGGLVDNLPVGEVRDRCQADIVIAVNVGSPLKPADQVNSLLSVTGQMISILTEQNVQKSLATLKSTDILISPNLEGITAADFAKSSETADRGREAANALTESLSALTVSEEYYSAWRSEIVDTKKSVPKIDSIEITGLEVVNPAAVERHIRLDPQGTLDVAELDQDLMRVYGDGFYEKVDYSLMNIRERNILRVMPVEKSWGPNYMRVGFNLQSETKNGSEFSLIAAYHKTWINRLGGELILAGGIGSKLGAALEYYQPLDARQRTFIETILSSGRQSFSIWQNDQKLAAYWNYQSLVSLSAGLNVGLLGQVRVGWRETWQKYSLETGPPTLPSDNQKYGSWFADVNFDQMNRLYFPTKGWAVAANYAETPEKNFSKFSAEVRGAYELYDVVLAMKFLYTDSPKGVLPYYDAATLGGFLKLSAFTKDQLLGDQIEYGHIRIEKIMGRLPLGLRGDMRVGLAFETGRVGGPITETELTGWLDSITIYLGGETPLGPAYLAYGYSTSGSQNFYLFIGTP